jgi:hypothetical protein
MTQTAKPKLAKAKLAKPKLAKPKPAAQPPLRPLVQQQADFTNEGSPPPGKVGAHVPSSGPLAAPPEARPGGGKKR